VNLQAERQFHVSSAYDLFDKEAIQKIKLADEAGGEVSF
jgi:hypothetical protein